MPTKRCSLKISDIQTAVVEDFAAMCRANGWDYGEVIEILMIRAIEKEESLAFSVHSARVRRKNGVEWQRKYGV